MECRTSKGWKKAKALIDSGAQLNLVSQLFVKEAGWQLRPEGAPAVETVDGRDVQVYGELHMTMSITDRQGRQRQQCDEYIATDIRDYNLILGEPWL